MLTRSSDFIVRSRAFGITEQFQHGKSRIDFHPQTQVELNSGELHDC